ncbi:hypothetical protein J6590_105598, partial [Homalodisca vitripennis]
PIPESAVRQLIILKIKRLHNRKVLCKSLRNRRTPLPTNSCVISSVEYWCDVRIITDPAQSVSFTTANRSIDPY